ncbi:MAG: hypothetical protein IPL33_14855 [Sphingobacteriales bacterium]|nr:hypothetical protein [Sphingobacteriales bacterium]
MSIGDSFPFSLGNDVTACGSTFVNAGGAYSSYLWNTGATTSGITVSNSGTYSVTVTNSAGCTAADAVVVSIGDSFPFSLGSDVTACGSTFVNAGGAYSSYLWNTELLHRASRYRIAARIALPLPIRRAVRQPMP